MKPEFQVGSCLVAPSRNTIRRNGRNVHLEPKVMQVLVYLAEHPGEVVGKEELIRAVWADTFVTDDVLKRCVSRLRKAFDDDPRDPKAIETIAKGGYRLLLSVTAIDQAQIAASDSQPIWKSNNKRLLMATAGLFVIAAVAGTVLLVRSPRIDKTSEWKVESISTLAGWQGRPTFSPDGNSIAFHYSSENSKGPDIFVKVIGDEKALQVTNKPPSWCPSWSPGGQTIAYTSAIEQSPGKWIRTIMLMTSLGGLSHVIRRASVDYRFCKLAWSPDGKWLAYSDDEGGGKILKAETVGPSGVFLISATGSDVRRLTTAPPTTVDGDVSFSPDGQQIAFVRERTIYSSDIYVVSVSGGEPRRVTFLNAGVWSPTWTPDGRGIVFSLGGYVAGFQASGSTEGTSLTSGIYVVPVSGGQPERLSIPQTNIMNPELSRAGDKIAYEKQHLNHAIWRVSLSGTGDSAKKFIASSVLDGNPHFSPDGSKIAFGSLRDGYGALWICDADGTNYKRLTTVQTGGSPAWSPDGKQIAFDDRVTGTSQIYLIEMSDYTRRKVTQGEFDHHVPTWSADGQWLYFGSNRTGKDEVWKLSLRTGEIVQVTHGGGLYPQESPDTKFVYYSKVPHGDATLELWRVPVNGGREERVIAEADQNWRVRPEGIYFAATVPRGSQRQPVLKLLSFSTGKIRVVAKLSKPVSVIGRNLAVSPDGQHVLYAQFDALSLEIMMAKGRVW